MASPKCVNPQEIAEAITENTKNNFARVVGLRYFCGGAEQSNISPTLKCSTNAHRWIDDIDNRTKENWDDFGRIELAKQYALDSAFTHLAHCASKHKNVWSEVKKAFLEIYPEERTLPSLMTELAAVTRKHGETLTELYIRIEQLVEKLEVLKPTGKDVYADMFVSIFLNALPKDFAYVLKEDELTKPLTVYKKALKYVASHPNLKLTDDVVRKEKVVSVNTIPVQKSTVVTHQIPPSRIRPPCQHCGLNNHDSHQCRTLQAPVRNRFPCQKCGLSNHVTQNCRAYECFRCHKLGHTSRYCTVRLPPFNRSNVTCFTCGKQGHTNYECKQTYTVPFQNKKKTSMNSLHYQ